MAATEAIMSESKLKWYVVNTYSGHENRAKLTLLERIKNSNMDAQFGDVLIPTESVMEVVKGQRRTSTRKFYPGYMFVQMDLNERSFHLVKNTPKITGFLGGTHPTPVPEKDITGIHSAMTEGTAKPKPKIVFSGRRYSARHRGTLRQFLGHHRGGQRRQAKGQSSRLDVRSRNPGRARLPTSREADVLSELRTRLRKSYS